jgi:hypothetical protein
MLSRRSQQLLSQQTPSIVTAAVIASTLIAPLAVNAGQYEALCGGAKCTVNVSPTEISSPFGSIPSRRVTYWGNTGESKTSVGTGVATTILFGGVGLLGFLAKNHQYNFTINGFDNTGKSISMSFEFKNDKPVKVLMQELVAVTGLGMGQTRTAEEIKAAESGTAETLGPMPKQPNNLGQSGLGSLAPDQTGKGKNCWSTYLENNPAMKQWAALNPAQAAQNKKKFADC